MPGRAGEAPRALHPRVLGEDDLPALQAFLDANPEYFLTVSGRPPRRDEALQEWAELPPPGSGWTRRDFLGLCDDAGRIQGFTVVVADLFAPRVWHIGLYVIASALHGSGVAAATLHALEAGMAAEGARFVRLGVVVGNAKAERFWAREGWREVRVRHGLDVGGCLRDVRVCVKPVGADDAPGWRETYLALVPRDVFTLVSGIHLRSHCACQATR